MAEVRVDDGTKIAYRTVGNGPTDVLLVHCWGNSSVAFDEMLNGFDARGLRILVPDLRGSGASDRPDSGYSLERHTSDMLAVADHADAKKFVVVGHSMGGQIAMRMACTAQDRIKGSVLLMPVPPSGCPLDEDTTNLFRNSSGNRESVTTIYGFGSPDMEPETRERMLDDAMQVAKPAIQEGFDAWTQASFVDLVGETRAPTLVVATDDPFYAPEVQWEKTASVIPGARMAVVPGCGHWGPVERPREIQAVIQAFLTAVSY
jgi:non-heme chloroperoxidase